MKGRFIVSSTESIKDTAGDQTLVESCTRDLSAVYASYELGNSMRPSLYYDVKDTGKVYLIEFD